MFGICKRFWVMTVLDNLFFTSGLFLCSVQPCFPFHFLPCKWLVMRSQTCECLINEVKQCFSSDPRKFTLVTLAGSREQQGEQAFKGKLLFIPLNFPKGLDRLFLFCTFLFHCIFYSYFSFFTIYMLLCCVTLYNFYFYYFALSTERTWFDYISLLIIPCIIYYVTNKETLTLTLTARCRLGNLNKQF